MHFELPAFCALNIAFGIEGHNCDNILISPSGEVFCKDFGPSFLGLVKSQLRTKLSPSHRQCQCTAFLVKDFSLISFYDLQGKSPNIRISDAAHICSIYWDARESKF